MPGCPACGRPVALARPNCLYCGAALPATVAPPPKQESAPAGAPAGPPRVLVVLELSAVRAEALVRSGLGSYEAELLVRRGGLHLHRVLEAAEAEAEAARLARAGVAAVLVPELEARALPSRVTGGERRAGRLVLRGEAGLLEVPDTELLLVVSGPIAREALPRAERQKVDSARLEPGWLAHLHRRADPRPLEIDAANFSPGFAVTGSSRLEIEAWLGEIAASVPRDEGFRWLPPALAAAEPEAGGPLAAASSLRAGRQRPRRRRGGASPELPLVLDNVAQFRFYSGWRAAVERRRTGSRGTGAAC